MPKGYSKIKDGGNYAHNLARCEVSSLVDKLRDREPTPAWVGELNATLKHFKMNQGFLAELVIASGRKNLLGRAYTHATLQNMIAGYRLDHSFTKNAQKTINDHLDILVDYLSKPDDAPVDPYRSVTSYGIKDIYPSPNQIAQEEEPKTLLQRLEESGRKPFLPKSGYETVHKSEYVPYGDGIYIDPNPKVHKVKLTKVKVHIIRR